jgi:Holliday junction resolvase RusA-like endonuclease
MKFTIILPPKGQMRDRSRVNFTKGGRPFNQNYKDPDQRLEERKMVSLMLAHRPPAPLTGPLVFGMKAFLPVPASKSKKFKAEALAGQIRPTTTPDLDNLLKNIKDTMKGIFWLDDKQIVGYTGDTGKYYGEPARWEIEIQPWAP